MRFRALFLAALLTAAPVFAQQYPTPLPTMTRDQISKIEDYSPGTKWGALVAYVRGLADQLQAILTADSLRLPTVLYASSAADHGDPDIPGSIASALAVGGDVYLTCGTYTVGTTLTMSVAGTHLRGANPVCVVIQAKNGLNADVLRVGYAGAQRLGMRVSGIQFNGNEGNNTSGTLVTFRDAGDSRFDNNRLISWEDNGLLVEATVSGIIGTDISYNDFVGGKGPAIYQKNSGADPTDNRYSHNDIGGDPAQALFTACTSNAIPGECAVVRVTSGKGFSFNNNHVWCGTSHTIDLALIGSAAIWDVDIESNTFENSWLDAVYVSGVSSGTINGNKFYQVSKGTDATSSAIFMTSTNAWSVYGNEVRGTTTLGNNSGRPLDVVSITSGNNNLVYGNLGRDLGTTTPGPTPGYGARIISGGTNVLYGNKGYGSAGNNSMGANEITSVANDQWGTIPIVTFANLGTPGNGRVYFCSDCTINATCAGSGTGALAKRINGAWVCN